MKFERAGFLTKLVILILLVATATGVLNMRAQLVRAEQDRQAVSRRIALQTQENAALADAIRGADDPVRIAGIARNKLGLATPGEIIFYDASN